MVKLKSFSNAASQYVKSIPKALLNSTLDLLESSDFISRTVGMANSYNDIMAVVQSLGREPVSLLGKDYLFIFDHVRRNYKQGTTVMSSDYNSNGSTDDGNELSALHILVEVNTTYEHRSSILRRSRHHNVLSTSLNVSLSLLLSQEETC